MERLIDICGQDNVSVDPVDLDRYSCDALTPHRVFHDADILNALAWAVVKPGSADEVSQVMRLACDYEVPVVPHGGGTGVMGAAIPVQGGVILDLKGLDRVISVNAEDMTVVVESGAILADVSAALEPYGLMLGHDPWSVPIATVGGAISTNGVGYLAAAHGPMGRQVAALEVVLPTGEMLTTRPVPKSSSGPNLNHLFIGSEGNFGVITKATLHVFRVPEERSFSAFGVSVLRLWVQRRRGMFGPWHQTLFGGLVGGVGPSGAPLPDARRVQGRGRGPVQPVYGGMQKLRRCGPRPGPHPGLLEPTPFVGAIVQTGDAGPAS